MLPIFVSVATGFSIPAVAAAPRHAVLTAARSPAVRADFFGDLKKGLTKLQAGSYDEAAVKAALCAHCWD